MYRDDADAADARVLALKAELRVANAEIATHARAFEPCSSKEHAALEATFATLTRRLSEQKRDTKASPFGDLDAELVALQVQLADLELLQRGPDAIRAKLEETEAAVAALEERAERDDAARLTVPAPPEDAVWVPRRGVVRRAARWWLAGGVPATVITTAVVAAPTPAVVLSALLAVAGSLAVGWRMVRERQRVLEIARTAAAVHRIDVVGEFPESLAERPR